MIRATIKVIPWRETHVIQTRNYDRLQKIIMVFLAAQCSKLKKTRLKNTFLKRSVLNLGNIKLWPLDLKILVRCGGNKCARGCLGLFLILFQIVLSELSIRSQIGTVCFRYPNLTALFCNLSILTKYVE